MFQHIIKLILPMNTTPPKIYQRLSNYIDHNSEYIDVSTQHIDLPTNFAKATSQTINHPHNCTKHPTKKRPPKGGPSKLNPIPHSALHRFLIQILRNNNIHYRQTNRFKNSNLFIVLSTMFFPAYDLSKFSVDVARFK
ncbi:hypothetical protein BACERE00185_03220 [Bacillus mobilis]|uniref:Uncharacterized protein n=1 Tax=Bacillus mobilis TaxID=2026190 RepID=A0A1Y5ZZ85_9BACI|nr:hypothetical protein BACERE00185_03220 [Bacillus mobilis]